MDEKRNEFSFADVYRRLTPRLLAESPTFAGDYEEMRPTWRLIRTRRAAGHCDRAAIEAWMENRYGNYDGES